MSTRCFALSNLAVTSSSLPLPKMARSNAVACQSCGTGRASCTPSSVRRFPWFGMNAKNTTHHSAQYRSLCTVTAERRPLEPRVRKAEWPPRVGKIFAWANSEINANSLVATSQLNSTQPSAGKRKCRGAAGFFLTVRAGRICVNAPPPPTLSPYLSNSGETSRGRINGISGQMMIAQSTSSIGISMITVSLSAYFKGTLATAHEIIRHIP